LINGTDRRPALDQSDRFLTTPVNALLQHIDNNAGVVMYRLWYVKAEECTRSDITETGAFADMAPRMK
jgi:hypothetical protein